MQTGFAILAHERLDRVSWLVDLLSGAGAPVVVHLDVRVPASDGDWLKSQMGEGVQVISTQRSEWGMFGLVAATLDCLRALMQMRDDLRHVCLLSGACLPLQHGGRPLRPSPMKPNALGTKVCEFSRSWDWYHSG